MHQAAYSAQSLPHSYELFETGPDDLEERILDLQRGTVAGLNVTIPHKERVLALVDDIDVSAMTVRAANTLLRTRSGVVRAYNTDAPALKWMIQQLGKDDEHGRGQSAVVLGSGGAARAAIASLLDIGATRIDVRARAFEDTTREVAFLRTFKYGSISTRPMSAPPVERNDLAVIIQATSCGMKGGPDGALASSAIDWETVPPSAVVIDVVYIPRDTPFLAEARRRGLASWDGLPMLARQGALAFSLWLKTEPPFEAMMNAMLDPAK